MENDDSKSSFQSRRQPKKNFQKKNENLEGLAFSPEIRIRILILESWKGQDWTWSFQSHLRPLESVLGCFEDWSLMTHPL